MRSDAARAMSPYIRYLDAITAHARIAAERGMPMEKFREGYIRSALFAVDQIVRCVGAP